MGAYYLLCQPKRSMTHPVRISPNSRWQCVRDTSQYNCHSCARPTVERLCHCYPMPQCNRHADGSRAFEHFSCDRRMWHSPVVHSDPIVWWCHFRRTSTRCHRPTQISHNPLGHYGPTRTWNTFHCPKPINSHCDLDRLSQALGQFHPSPAMSPFVSGLEFHLQKKKRRSALIDYRQKKIWAFPSTIDITSLWPSADVSRRTIFLLFFFHTNFTCVQVYLIHQYRTQ